MKTDIDSRPSLDLTVNQFRKRRGDLLLYGSWFGPDADDSEPCLVIIPLHARPGTFKPAVVCLSAAHYWRDEPRRTALLSREFAKGLGLKPTPSTCHRIVSLIYDHLDDLVQMPLRPHRHVITGGYAFIRDSESGEVRHVEAQHKV